MIANFTSIVLENGFVPIAPAVQKRLGLNPGDQVSISIKVLNRPKEKRGRSRYTELLEDKDTRVLTPDEQAELIAFANAELDSAVANAKKAVRKSNPELFDSRGRLIMRKAVDSLRRVRSQRKTAS
jgi:hypothetical protein